MAENNRTDEMNRMAENIRSDGQNRTDETNRDPAMLSLQSELEAMARETPEMPESFRQAWREAVRKDGLLGAFTGGLSAASGGTAAAIVFGLLAALLFKPRDKNK